MDPITIGLLAGAGLGALKGNANVKKEAENDRYRKVAVAMSPWTGQGDPGALNLGGPLESAASGAALGGQVGGMMGKMGAAGAQENVAGTEGLENAARGALGGQAQQLGAQYGVSPQGTTPYSMIGQQSLAGQYGVPQQQMASPGAFGGYKYNLMAQGY
jgi:hypothetical protein